MRLPVFQLIEVHYLNTLDCLEYNKYFHELNRIEMKIYCSCLPKESGEAVEFAANMKENYFFIKQINHATLWQRIKWVFTGVKV